MSEEPTNIPPTTNTETQQPDAAGIAANPTAAAFDPDKELSAPGTPEPGSQESIEAEYDRLEAARLEELAKGNSGGADGGAEGEKPGADATAGNPPAAAEAPDGESPEPAKPDADELERLKRKLREDAGRFGREKQTLSAQLKEAREALAALQAEEAKRAEEQRRREAEEARAAQEREPTEEEVRKIWGDEKVSENGVEYYLDLLRAMRSESKQMRAAMRAETEKANEQARGDAAFARMMADLERKVPGFGEVNKDAETNGFSDYLDERFPGTFGTRRNVVQAAVDAITRGAAGKDYDEAIAVVAGTVKGFAGLGGGQASPDGASGTTTKPQPKTIDAAKYVTPKFAGGSPAPASGAKKWTEAQVEALRQRAAEKGEAAYDAFEAWELQQRSQGNITPR